MAARAGLHRDDVVREAVAMIDEGAFVAEVSLGALARRLGIRPQSIYAHVDGADGLTRAVAVVALRELGQRVAEAGIGVSGLDAVAQIVRAHLAFARSRPGLYAAAIHPPGDDAELLDALTAAAAPLDRVLAGIGLPAEESVHWTRLFLSAVYGFVLLRDAGSFSLPASTAETEARLVEMLISTLDLHVA